MSDIPPMPEAFARDYEAWMDKLNKARDRLRILYPCYSSQCGYREPTCNNCNEVYKRSHAEAGNPPEPKDYGRFK